MKIWLYRNFSFFFSRHPSNNTKINRNRNSTLTTAFLLLVTLFMGAGGCFLILYTDSIYEEVLKLNTVAERNFVASLEISTTKGDFL